MYGHYQGCEWIFQASQMLGLWLVSSSTRAASLAGNQQSCGCYSSLKTLLVNMTFVFLGSFYSFLFCSIVFVTPLNAEIKHSLMRVCLQQCDTEIWLQVIITSAAVNIRSRLSSQLWKKKSRLSHNGIWLRMCGWVYLQCSWQPTAWKEWLRVIAVQLLAFVCVCGCAWACVCSSLVCD